MFKSAATKIAHNTTIPALAGNSDLRPLQDLITAEKTVLVSLQRLRVDLVKAGDALRIWGQGEGDDLGDILTASSMMLAHFSEAVSTYSSLHHSVRESMKSVRTREEALDDLRRRRRRVGASAEAAEKKLNKMSPEHKNLGVQTDALNKLREEMRALDGEIVHEETGLGDYKRKCTKDWMSFKFGGLVECCEKGVIAGDIGRQIIQSIPGDNTQPGLPRAFYNAHGHVGDLVVEAQRGVSQVVFSGTPSGHIPISKSPPQEAPSRSPFLPTPSLGSELTLGVNTYNPPPGPPPANRRASFDELGLHAPSAHAPPQFSSLPANKEHDPPPPPPVGPTQPLSLSVPYDNGVAQTEENQSLMASIADALSQSHRGFSLEDTTSVGHPAPEESVRKHESISGNQPRSVQSEPHGPATNGHVSSPRLTEEREGQWQRRATRRSTSPPSLPPGAAPAAIRAWDDRMGQGEDGTHSDRSASSSARMPSQRPISSSERDGEEAEDSSCERKRSSLGEGGVRGDGKHYEEDVPFSEDGGQLNVLNEQGTTPVQRSVSTGAASNASNATSLSRTGSQWRIPRVPPPVVDADADDTYYTTARERHSVYSIGAGGREAEDEIRTEESADTRAHNEAAAREVSRAMDELVFSAIAPPSSSGYATPKGPPPGYGSVLPAQSQPVAPYPLAPPQLLSSSMRRASYGSASYGSAPSSPILPPNPPFANRGRTSSQSIGVRIPTPTPVIATSSVDGSPSSPRSASPMYRSPPPEYPRPTPPFSTNLMASSSSSLNSGVSLGAAPRTISAAAFRRPQARSPSGTEGPADTSPLTFRKPSGSPAPSFSTSRHQQTASGSPSLAPVPISGGSRVQLSVVNPDLRMSEDEEEEEGRYSGAYGGESVGYGAGRYVSDLERRG